MGFASIKLWGAVIVIAIMAAMLFTIKILANDLNKAKAEVVAINVELNHALEAGKLCSENTERLQKLTDEKQETVKKAQEQAAIIAKGNQALANKILAMEPQDKDRCTAAAKLFKDYKALAGKGK